MSNNNNDTICVASSGGEFSCQLSLADLIAQCILEISPQNAAWANFMHNQDQSFQKVDMATLTKGLKGISSVGRWQRLTSGPDAQCQFDILMLEQLRLTETNYLGEKSYESCTKTHTHRGDFWLSTTPTHSYPF